MCATGRRRGSSEFDLADLVDEVGVTLQEQGEDADPNLLRNWVNALGGECRVRADRDLLYRVFVNLGRNAFDAGASTVTVRPQNGGAYLLVDVDDNGPGVPARRGGAALQALHHRRPRRRRRPRPLPSPATWCAPMAARSPWPRPAPHGTTFRFTLPANGALTSRLRDDGGSMRRPSSFARVNARMRRALTPKSDSPSRLLERMSMRLPLVPSARMRTTMSSWKPNQSVVSTASRRPSAGARATTSQPIAIATRSTRLKASAGGR